ncbi:MAG: hypothetical protein ACI97A_004097, partial [Planctomycetota bacterium]
MNLSLFKSIHGVIALLVCIVSTAWLFAIGAEAGTRQGSDPSYVLWSGWIATGLMLLAMLYCVRKYMHKMKYSPEMKLKVPISSLEAADAGLNEVRRRIARGDFNSMEEANKAAQRVVADEGVGKVIAVRLREGDATLSEPAYFIDVKPPEKYGRMTKWLHAHIYYGLASGVLVWLHGGFAMTHPMGILLNVLTIVVLVTGVIGIFLFAYGPSWMTRHEKDLNFEENFVLDASLKDKIRIHLDDMKKSHDSEPEILKTLEAGFSSGDHARLTGEFQEWQKKKKAVLVSADAVIAASGTEEGPDSSVFNEVAQDATLKAALEKASGEEDAKKRMAAMKKVRDGSEKKNQVVEDAVVLLGQRA